MFDEIRGHFGILRHKIVPLISQSISSVTEMKSFLQLSFPELSAELSDADSIEGIMDVVVKKMPGQQYLNDKNNCNTL